MLRSFTVAIASLAIAAPAFACGGATSTAKANTAKADQVHVASAHDPAETAKSQELVGANCAYTTGMTAKRVLEEGSDWTFAGTLTPSSNELSSRVAAPYTTGPNQQLHVIANTVLEDYNASAAGQRVRAEGKQLELNGTTYVLLTQFSPANS